MTTTRIASRWLTLVLTVTLSAILLGACSRAGQEGRNEPGGAPASGASAKLEAPAPVAAVAEASSGSAVGAVPGALGLDRFVVRSADLVLRVEDVGHALVTVRQLTVDFGGIVLSSTSSIEADDDGGQTATLTVQVPSDRFDQFLNQLRANPLVVDVEREHVQSQDVTEEYLDLDARLRNLRATEQRYLALLERAQTIDEILRVEQELARVRYEIEQVTGRKQYLERHVAYAQATIALLPVPVERTADQRPFDFAAVVVRAWHASLAFLGRVAEGVILVTVFLWWLWPLLGVLGVLALRRRTRPQAPDTASTGQA